MRQVADQLVQNPCLHGVCESSVAEDHLGFVENLCPRDMVQGNPFQLALVDLDGMFPRAGRDVVGQSDDRIKALVAGDVEVVLHLVSAQLAAARLGLYQRRPDPPRPGDSDHAVGRDGPLSQRKRHLKVGLHRAGGGAEPGGHPAAETADRHHGREQSRRGPLLLLRCRADPGDRKQPSRLPGFVPSKRERRDNATRLGLPGPNSCGSRTLSARTRSGRPRRLVRDKQQRSAGSAVGLVRLAFD